MTEVPCKSCTLCCRGESIVLHPHLGDDVSKYETDSGTNPLTGEPAQILKHKPNGDCYYLGEGRCTIYEDRPLICREFDCRKMVLSLTKRQQAGILAAGRGDTAVFNAGKARLYTLSGEERLAAINQRNNRNKG